MFSYNIHHSYPCVLKPRSQKWVLTFTSELPVVFATALVPTDHTDNILPVLILGPGTLVVGALLWDGVTGGEGGGGVHQGRTGGPRTERGSAIESVVERQGGHGDGADPGAGTGQQVGVSPYRGRGGHQGHVGHRGEEGEAGGRRSRGDLTGCNVYWGHSALICSCLVWPLISHPGCDLWHGEITVLTSDIICWLPAQLQLSHRSVSSPRAGSSSPVVQRWARVSARVLTRTSERLRGYGLWRCERTGADWRRAPLPPPAALSPVLPPWGWRAERPHSTSSPARPGCRPEVQQPPANLPVLTRPPPPLRCSPTARHRSQLRLSTPADPCC